MVANYNSQNACNLQFHNMLTNYNSTKCLQIIIPKMIAYSNSEKVFPVNQVYDYNDYFYVNPSAHTTHVDAPEYGQAYGAAFLCHRELFNRVTFINARFMIKGKDGKEFPFDYQPTETTAGHDLLRTKDSICLKSKDFFYFHVDHLSGYEFNKTL